MQKQKNRNRSKISLFAGTILVFILIVGSASLSAQKMDQSHSAFDSVLKKYIKNGNVKYKALLNDRTGLDSYLKSISSVTEAEYKTFNENQKIAFLINAYNAYTLDLILKHYPVKSIGDIGGPVRLVNLARGTPWKKFTFPLLGADRNLDWIEHSKLRVEFTEPRIHFAINCASVGCPLLRNESYRADKLESQLQDSFVKFLSETSKNRLDKSKNTIYLSKIFDWFKGDFEKKSGSVLAFVRTGFPEKIPDQIKIEYTDYDWTLNEAK
ncbi:DUF547 domain-containing protein [Leptospira sp. GIMC2001]|uniref:DUF547 domain-containing protein n=1 Tax=Leptospira sp. GIMC2001 TaxID=1513297 RepID=UPI0023494970|nr:DUF547 domain-containing protein [Leptospira sp. GIMC2001]WCL47541.1 DUF547 domain-containing protein [Leptospira sp. GIMC2001]